MIPRRYLFASLFIAAMLILLAIVQAPRSAKEGGVGGATDASVAALDSFETLAELPLQEGWSPRFIGAQDPDQPQPWPFSGGFGFPWEPASPYLRDQGVVLNSQQGRSEVVFWRNLEWRRYRFEVPLVSARLDPAKGRWLLVTLKVGPARFETRLMEIPEGRTLWTVDSGPWSRFSWDGRSVLLGLRLAEPTEALLLSSLPVEGDLEEPTLAAWGEKDLAPAPRNWPNREALLPQAAQDFRGHRLVVPWGPEARLWFPTRDRLWVSQGDAWTLWGLPDASGWTRLQVGVGSLRAHPPMAMARIRTEKGEAIRETSPLTEATWEGVPAETPAWPEVDPAWTWMDRSAMTAWDQRWGVWNELPKERQREALLRVFRPEWKVARSLRASVAGWLPEGPEIALRERTSSAWVWVGNRILLVRLQPTERLRKLKNFGTGR